MGWGLGAYAHKWIEGRVARGELIESSAGVEMTRLRSLIKVHGARPVEDLNEALLLLWQESIGRKAPNTRKAYLCTVQGFCRWLVKDGYLLSDPSVDLARPRIPRRPPRALPASDVERTLIFCKSSRERLIVWLEVGCALRAAEVSALDLDDVDQEAPTGQAGPSSMPLDESA